MDPKFNKLKQKFVEIQNMGWIKSVNNYGNSVGMTFESLLGKTPDYFSYPDYDGIEIKTQNAGTDYPLTLFSLAPSGSVFPKLEDLRKKYGYYDYQKPEDRKLNVEFYKDKNQIISNRYFFNLEINRKEQKIYLVVYNIHHEQVEKDAFWYFDDIKEKLNLKLKYLGFVFARGTKDENGHEIFKYIKLECYKFKNFDTFLDLLERNIISVSINTQKTKYGPSIGKPKSGCYFKIGKHDLRKLFDVDSVVEDTTQDHL